MASPAAGVAPRKAWQGALSFYSQSNVIILARMPGFGKLGHPLIFSGNAKQPLFRPRFRAGRLFEGHPNPLAPVNRVAFGKPDGIGIPISHDANPVPLKENQGRQAGGLAALPRQVTDAGGANLGAAGTIPIASKLSGGPQATQFHLLAACTDRRDA